MSIVIVSQKFSWLLLREWGTSGIIGMAWLMADCSRYLDKCRILLAVTP